MPTIRDLAANCLASLAAAEAEHRNRQRPDAQATADDWRRWRRAARFDRITALIELAEHLTSKDANLHFQLGAIASDWHDHETALRELNAAIRIEPEHPLFLAHLARTHQRRGHGNDRADAHFFSHRAFDATNVLKPTEDDEAALDIVLEVWGRLGEADSSKRLHAMRRFARRIPRIQAKLGEPAVRSQAERELTDHLRTQRDWEAGHLQLTLGRFHLAAPGSAHLAEQYFGAALASLRHSPKDESRHNIRALLALALANQGRRDAALREAEQAVSINPLSSAAHSALGHVCNAAGDLERARTAWSDALLWKPDDPGLHWELGFCNWRLGREAANRAVREQTLNEAGRYLRQAGILFAMLGKLFRVNAFQ